MTFGDVKFLIENFDGMTINSFEINMIMNKGMLAVIVGFVKKTSNMVIKEHFAEKIQSLCFGNRRGTQLE